jgi:hypothetical protein
MAFNFNWSPLTADEKFYERARDLLTTALNKSPKPPIIVDDILVTEFNLGSVPPELEILEIGDIAEDRFRGIFKMCYSGDAFLTLKTRVQVRLLLSLSLFWASTPSDGCRLSSGCTCFGKTRNPCAIHSILYGFLYRQVPYIRRDGVCIAPWTGRSLRELQTSSPSDELDSPMRVDQSWAAKQVSAFVQALLSALELIKALAVLHCFIYC